MSAKNLVKYFVALLFVNLVFIAPAFAQNAVVPFNEKFVIGAMEKFTAAESTYFYAPQNDFNFGDFQELRTYDLIDAALAYGEKYGYQFSLSITIRGPGTPPEFQLSAIPHYYGKGGKRSFFLDRSGVIRGADRNGAPATNADPIIPPLPCGEDRIIPLMRSLNTAETAFFENNGANINFGTMTNLSQNVLVDGYLGNGERCGYRFTLIVIAANVATATPASYRINATPVSYPVNGFRSYYTDQTGVLRGADHGGAPATVNDPPIKN